MQRKSLKVVTIGGGSTYTPELIDGFIKRYDELPITEMWLVDVEEGRNKLEIVSKLAQRMWDASPYNVKVYSTLDRKTALKNADFVTTQFRVGQLEARIKDERIPFSYGLLGQETNGAGGIFKALRTIPVILEIIEDMSALCPNAWLINFTNPSGMVTEAILRYTGWRRVIGLCNVPVNAMMKEPQSIDATLSELTYKFAGLNHFHWHRVFDRNGKEVTAKIIDAMFNNRDTGIPANIHKVPFLKEQLNQMNLLPCGYHRYYYRQEEMLQRGIEEYHTTGTRAEKVQEMEAALLALYQNQSLSSKPELLSQRGGLYYSESACEAISAIYNNKQSHIVVSTQNNGAVPDLDNDCAVEVSCFIGAAGALPVAFGRLAPAERGWLQLMKNMELCVCEAAVTGDYGLVLQAFIMNPLIPGGETAKRVMDELFIAHQKFLPRFKDVINRLVNIEIKDPVARRLSA
ncbi:6-phospho-beta-glucosidase [Mixta intestinalis]|uniref:Putative 6-phospho-beta-glucosidase n=1 Tax=Mixta intestinalis TaxID=1615494 RepID=A0A6P1Q1J4_9GAMM|nr:6-phospho-beta-glucosidase [Mixta intestinalis]QHM71888.1 putative 6-phospho-beta-glucosidase [Mixta intestinalis]